MECDDKDRSKRGLAARREGHRYHCIMLAVMDIENAVTLVRDDSRRWYESQSNGQRTNGK